MLTAVVNPSVGPSTDDSPVAWPCHVMWREIGNLTPEPTSPHLAVMLRSLPLEGILLGMSTILSKSTTTMCVFWMELRNEITRVHLPNAAPSAAVQALWLGRWARPASDLNRLRGPSLPAPRVARFERVARESVSSERTPPLRNGKRVVAVNCTMKSQGSCPTRLPRQSSLSIDPLPVSCSREVGGGGRHFYPGTAVAVTVYMTQNVLRPYGKGMWRAGGPRVTRKNTCSTRVLLV